MRADWEKLPDCYGYPMGRAYFVTERKSPLDKSLAKLKSECTGNVWICGCASVAGQLLKEGRIDRLWLSVIPVVLGKGIRLFPELLHPLPLKLVKTQQYNGIVDLVYEKR